MKQNYKTIPIIAATTLFSLMSADCAEQFAEAGSASALSENTDEQTVTENTTASTKASTAKKTSAATSVKKKKTTTTAAQTETNTDTTTETAVSEAKPNGLLASVDDLEIYDTDGMDSDYEFIYDGKIFEALYTPENWKIIDSYKIKNHSDMTVICEVLCRLHPIHDKDYNDYRTPEDMVYEWEQHNLAYSLLPDDNPWKENAKDVDLDPEDQGKGLYELFKDRTGRDILSALW